MPQIWVIAPFYFDPSSPGEFEDVWKHDLESDLISIGWGELGDISTMSKEQIFEHIRDTYRDESPEAARNYRGSLLYFCHRIRPGDTVIARRGRKQIAAIGTVKRAAYYDLKKNTVARNGLGAPYANHIDIQWAESPRDKSFAKIVFGMQTVYKITEKKYRTWLQTLS